MERAFKARVSGRVQRSGYRRFVLEIAQEVGVSGYVRNELDGSVTVFVQGEEGLVEKFLERVRETPLPTAVKDFEVEAVEPNSEVRFFKIEFGSLAEELQEGFGSMEREFRDYREEFGGFVGEFRDYRQEFRDYREEFGGLWESLETIGKSFEALLREPTKTFRRLAKSMARYLRS